MSDVGSTVVDAHHHLWDTSRHQYTWMTDDLAAIRRTFDTTDLETTIRPHGVRQTVVVQALQSTDETAELLELARMSDVIAGVVGWVDLTSPDVSGEIDRLRSSPGGEYLKGVRHLVHDEDDPNWIRRDAVVAGLERVAGAGLTFDLLVRQREMPAAISALRALPGLRVVLDHLAKPLIAEGSWQPWADLVAELAELSNISCKVSGLVTEASWTSWRREDLEPYVAWTRQCFGASRLLFGSDWPVCLVAASYGEVLAATRWLLRDLTVADAQAVFADNAQRIYRLPAVLGTGT